MNHREWLETNYPHMLVGEGKPVNCAVCGEETRTDPENKGAVAKSLFEYILHADRNVKYAKDQYRLDQLIDRLEFCATDNLGFWEVRGYHNHGDVWKEERYS